MRRSAWTSWLRRAAMAAAGALAWLSAPPASAAPQAPAPASEPADPAVQEAREAFRIGTALAKQGQWADALAAFERSARLRPHAVTAYNIAFCERALGRFTRARKIFAHALAVPGDEMPKDLAAEARGYLAEAESRLARAVITLSPPGAAVAVDGRPLEAAGGTAEHPELVAGTRDHAPPEAVAASSFDLVLDPGAHVIVVRAPGGRDTAVTRELAAGATVTLALAADPGGARDAGPRTSTPVPARTVGAAVAFGLAGASAIVAAVTGGLALRKKAELDGSCQKKDQCPEASQSTIDAMKALGNASTATIVLAVAGAGVGTTLLLVGSSSDRRPPRATPVTPKPEAHLTVTLGIGPGSATLRGAF